jgi:hypothetical protein
MGANLAESIRTLHYTIPADAIPPTFKKKPDKNTLFWGNITPSKDLGNMIAELLSSSSLM